MSTDHSGSTGPTSFAPHKSRWGGTRWIIAVTGIAVIVLVLAGPGSSLLMNVFGQGSPPQVTFSGQGAAQSGSCPWGGGFCGLVGSVSLPSGAYVSLNWSTVDGGAVRFYLAQPNQTEPSTGLCYTISASSGTCHFVSAGGDYGVYAFDVGGAPAVVRYSGSY